MICFSRWDDVPPYWAAGFMEWLPSLFERARGHQKDSFTLGASWSHDVLRRQRWMLVLDAGKLSQYMSSHVIEKFPETYVADLQNIP
jgi:hypothetical protein